MAFCNPCRVLQSAAFGNVELEIEPLCDCPCNSETVSGYYLFSREYGGTLSIGIAVVFSL